MDGSIKGEGVVPSSSKQVIKVFWGPKASKCGGVIRRSSLMLKMEISRNKSEPERPERSHRCDFGAMNGSKNRCRMRKISCFVHFPKRQNFGDWMPSQHAGTVSKNILGIFHFSPQLIR